MTDTTTKPLNQFCVTVLAGLLSAPDWYENPGQLYRAGQILEEVLPAVEVEPRLLTDTPTTTELADHKAKHKAWSTVVAPWQREPTPKEVEVMKVCVKKFADAKKLGGSIHLLPLLNLAALKPED